MKRSKIISAVILAAAMLAGCSNSESSSDSSTGTSSSGSPQQSSSTDSAATGVNGGVSSESSAGNNSERSEESGSDASDSSDSSTGTEESSSEETGDPDATFLIGPAGDTIMRSELAMIFTNDGMDGSAETLSEENFSAVICEGFAYLAEPTGICRTSIDNADVFDGEQLRFSDVSSSAMKNYERVSVGETFCGLTLTKAEVNFAHGNDGTEYVLGDGSTKLGSELGIPEIYFMGCSAEFSGQVTLTGYICVADEDENGLWSGSIIFVPSGCECMLPVMGYRFDPDAGIVHYQRINSHKGLVWANEYGSIFLGNADMTTADISGIPGDGSFVKARVTLENVSLTCAIGMTDSCSADIAELEIISE